MKFSVHKQSFLRELSFIGQHVIDKKGFIPALTHVLIEASGKGVIRLTGTDLDQTLTCETEGVVQKGGACALPAHKLIEIVKNLPNAEILIETKTNNRAEIKCERSHFKLAGIGAKNMPELPKFKDSSVQLPSEIFRTMIERTRFAITQEESRYTLSGAKLFLRRKGVRMVSTDGHRLALIDNKSITSKQEFDCLIPKKSLAAVSSIAQSHEGAIGMSLDENHIYFEIGARTLISRLLAGEFPNYEMILPKDNEHKVRFDCAELLQAIRRVAVMANKSHAICFEFARKKLRIFTQEESEGAAEETLTAEDYKGAEMIIGLNSQFLSEYLSIICTGDVNLEFKSPNTVVQITPLDDSGYNSFNIIMPMHISNVADKIETTREEQTQTVNERSSSVEAQDAQEQESQEQQEQDSQKQDGQEEPEEEVALPKAA